MKISKKFNQLVWEYNLKPEEFKKILAGKKEEGWFNREWAVARVLENMNYYEAKKIINFDFLRENWKDIKKRLFKKNIKEGYEYVLQKKALSTAK
jgi:hypothetical protein